MSKTQYWLKKDGKDVEVGAGEFWRAFALGAVLLLVNLPRYILQELVWHFDIALRKACNALGRRGFITVGGVVLQLRYPRQHVEWLPDGLPPELAKLLVERGDKTADQPHFDVCQRIYID